VRRSAAAAPPHRRRRRAPPVRSPRNFNSQSPPLSACRFAFQQLKGTVPILGARSAELFFLAVGALLLAAGVPILVAALNTREVGARYDDAGPLAGLSDTARQAALWAALPSGLVYAVDVPIPERMEPPIYVVYDLADFRQNYRRYVRSYDPDQMKSGIGADGAGATGVDACQPFQYEGGAEDASAPYGGAVLPCGQIAHSFFNDTFSLALGGADLAVDSSSIAWAADAEHLYGDVAAVNYNAEAASRGGNTSALALNQNQHWMVWMRPGGKRGVQKLYGRVDAPLPAGATVRVTVANRYNTYGFGGAKRIILTTNSWVGGRNIFLPAIYLAASGLSFATAAFFFLAYDASLLRKRRPGDASELSWVKGPGGGPRRAGAPAGAA
jgi:hypothetical protein